MALERNDHDLADPDNPVTLVRHVSQHSDGACLGLMVWIWCPGCQALHAPKFKCLKHGGPRRGPIWVGNPYGQPFTMSPSLLVHETSVSPRCHSFIRNGSWEFLEDSTHALAGQTVPLESLPNWLIRDFSEE